MQFSECEKQISDCEKRFLESENSFRSAKVLPEAYRDFCLCRPFCARIFLSEMRAGTFLRCLSDPPPLKSNCCSLNVLKCDLKVTSIWL